MVSGCSITLILAAWMHSEAVCYMLLEKLNHFSESFNLGCDKKAFELRLNSKFYITEIVTELLPFGNFKLLVKCCGIITGCIHKACYNIRHLRIVCPFISLHLCHQFCLCIQVLRHKSVKHSTWCEHLVEISCNLNFVEIK